MNKRSFLAIAFAIGLMPVAVPASPAGATPWFNGGYLYRYAFWGLRQQFSPSDDYKMFPYRTIENAPPAYEFPRAASGARLPVEVEYKTAIRSSGSRSTNCLNQPALMRSS